jgi:hypothetical protein
MNFVSLLSGKHLQYYNICSEIKKQIKQFAEDVNKEVEVVTNDLQTILGTVRYNANCLDKIEEKLDSRKKDFFLDLYSDSKGIFKSFGHMLELENIIVEYYENLNRFYDSFQENQIKIQEKYSDNILSCKKEDMGKLLSNFHSEMRCLEIQRDEQTKKLNEDFAKLFDR